MDVEALRQEIAARGLAGALRSAKTWLRDESYTLATRKRFARVAIASARGYARALG